MRDASIIPVTVVGVLDYAIIVRAEDQDPDEDVLVRFPKILPGSEIDNTSQVGDQGDLWLSTSYAEKVGLL